MKMPRGHKKIPPEKTDIVIDHHYKEVSLHLSATINRFNQKQTSVNMNKQFIWAEQNQVNSIKVDSTVPGVKFYGDNTYGEYQMINLY